MNKLNISLPLITVEGFDHSPEQQMQTACGPGVKGDKWVPDKIYGLTITPA